jgi:hypothetical protein
MNSFQPSRGRIFFDVLCAAGIAASSGGAWIQTGASALLAAMAIATLYALVRFFDLFSARPAEVAAEPQRIEFAPIAESVAEVEPVPVFQEVRARLQAIEPQLVVDNADREEPALDVLPADEPVAPIKAARKAKQGRKPAARGGASKKAADVKSAADPIVATEIPPVEQAEQAIEPQPSDDQLHPQVSPLFEPEPFVRQQQRAMFGRKAG